MLTIEELVSRIDLTIEQQALIDPAKWGGYLLGTWQELIGDELLALWPTFTDEQKVAIAKHTDRLYDEITRYRGDDLE